jgi:D-alanyl-lipoteichoic acid acyltransferase DltB (MBOAT superfamily)
MWQDTVIALCQLAVVPAMIPTILGKDKPAFLTCVFNAVIVSIITMTLFSLELWFSGITASFIVIAWSILAIQKWKIDSKLKAIKDEV